MNYLFYLLSLFIFSLMQSVSASCQIDVVPYQLSYFHGSDISTDSRYKNNVAKLSGDGKKIVYIQSETGFDTSLSGWVSGRESALTSDSAAHIYLYDVDSQQSSLIYTGNFSFVSKDGSYFPQSLESGFSVDINYDGSQVVMAYTSTSFNSARDAISNSLVFATIDTSSTSTTQLSSLTLPGFSSQDVPLKLSGDGSKVVFVYSPNSSETTSTWSVEYYKDSDTSVLGVVSAQSSSSGISLSQGTGADGSDSEILWAISAEYFHSFDISYDGSKVIFGYPKTGTIVGVNSDGSNYHTIASVTADKPINVAISGDGSTVAYTERGSDTTIIYKNNFEGTSQSTILNKGTFASGALFLNDTGIGLVYNDSVAGPGGSYGYSSSSYFVYTDGSMITSELNKDLFAVSKDFSRVLTSYYNNAALDINSLSLGSRYLSDQNSIYLSSLYISGNSSSAYEIVMLITKSNPYTFKLSNYAATGKANVNAVYYPGDRLTIPYIAVGDSCYSAELKLIDSSNYTFELSDLQTIN